jgi:hypothetical protein
MSGDATNPGSVPKREAKAAARTTVPATTRPLASLIHLPLEPVGVGALEGMSSYYMT